MSFTYDTGTSVGVVRMLITDRDEASPIFQDHEIEAFLSLESNSVRLAAAQALDTIAVDQALVLKLIKTLHLSTDGPAVARALHEQAKALRDREEGRGAFAIAEMVNNKWDREEFSWKQFQRGVV